jgi:hypothetical protein
VGLLLLIALVLLQAFVGEGCWFLAAYGLIGIVALLSFILRSDSGPIVSVMFRCDFGCILWRGLTSRFRNGAREIFISVWLRSSSTASPPRCCQLTLMPVIVSLLVLAMVHVWIGFINSVPGKISN